MKKIDLHVHTTASDGEYSPSKLVDLALETGVKVIAICDHDNVKGVNEAVVYSKGKEVEVIPGVEISCGEDFMSEIHIVGLFIDYKNEELNKFLEKSSQGRIVSKKQSIKKLNQLGYEVSYEEAINEAGGSFGRPHIAKILMRKYPTEFPTMKDVFNKLLGRDKPAYVAGKKPNIKQCLDIIHEAKGIAILAHPGYFFEVAEKVIDLFAKQGGDGIEVESGYEDSKTFGRKEAKDLLKKFAKVAKEKKLLVSGGSDFHGIYPIEELGKFGVSEKEFEKLKSLVA